MDFDRHQRRLSSSAAPAATAAIRDDPDRRRTRFLWLESAPGAPTLVRLLARDEGGSRFTAASSPPEALERAEGGAFDFVVFAGTAGGAAAERWVRDLVRAAPESPVIVLLANGAPGSARRLLAAGARRCLDGTDLDARELTALFRAALKRGGDGLGGGRTPPGPQGGLFSSDGGVA